MKIAVMADENGNPDIKKLTQLIGQSLSNAYVLSMLPNDADLVLVIGGDGFMTHTVRTISSECPKFIGINRGTRGFLLNRFADTDDVLELIRTAQFIEFPLLSVELEDKDGCITTTTAFNDVMISRARGQAIRLRIDIDGVNLTSHFGCRSYFGDGLIVCTPGGCTGWSRSYHGLAIMPDSHSFGLTPVGPNEPDCDIFLPITIADNTIISINVLDSTKRPTLVIADSLEFPSIRRITIRKHERQVQLGFAPTENYYRKVLEFFRQKRTLNNGGLRCA